jgi:hypothetical protein
MASVPTPETPAAMLVGEDEEPLSQVAALILEVNEARQRRIRRNLHGKVYHPIEHIAEGAVHAASWLDDTAVLGHVGDQPVDGQSLGAAGNPDTREGVGRRPTVDQGAASGRPGNAHLEFIQGGLARLGGDKANTQQLGGGDHEDISNGGNIHSQVLQEELVPVLLGEARPDSAEVDEDGESLEVGDVVKRSGGGGGQAVRLGCATTRSSDISIGHAVWQSG